MDNADHRYAPIGMILPFRDESQIPDNWVKFDGSVLDPDKYHDLWGLVYAHKDAILPYWKEMGGDIGWEEITLPKADDKKTSALMGWAVTSIGATLAIKAKRTGISDDAS